MLFLSSGVYVFLRGVVSMTCTILFEFSVGKAVAALFSRAKRFAQR